MFLDKLKCLLKENPKGLIKNRGYKRYIYVLLPYGSKSSCASTGAWDKERCNGHVWTHRWEMSKYR